MNAVVLSPQVMSAIERRSGGVVSLRLAWTCATQLVVGELSEAEQLLLIDHFSSPRSLDALIRFAGRNQVRPGQIMEDLRVAANESDFTLQDWLEALERVVLRMLREGRTASPIKMIGYLHCAAEFASANMEGKPLVEIVTEMLEQYGFDG